MKYIKNQLQKVKKLLFVKFIVIKQRKFTAC